MWEIPAFGKSALVNSAFIIRQEMAWDSIYKTVAGKALFYISFFSKAL